MYNLKFITLIYFIISSIILFSQDFKKDSTLIRSIYTEALSNGKAYDDLYNLTKNIGQRLSGSLGAEMAVQWGEQTLKKYDFDKVYLQKVMVPHWKRGTRERGFYISNTNDVQQITILALGGSVGTNGILKAPLVMVNSLEELKNTNTDVYKGKIIFLAEAMDANVPTAFEAYGKGFGVRYFAAIEAAKQGAVGVIIRTLSLSENDFPNTGIMKYEDDVAKIPAAAISTNDATLLKKRIEAGEQFTFAMEMDCQQLPDVGSYNVIGEITGSKYPNRIITVGGHLDSWDVGEGAHDDGTGIVHSMEALRILKTVGYKPQNTIRVVFFMNEENGNKGGHTYAEKAIENNEEHIFAIESDAGGFSPRGFEFSKTRDIDFITQFKHLFAPYQLTEFIPGGGGVDISPLGGKFENIGLIGFLPDSQRYFDIHHNNNDVFENVNKRELHLGCASIASLIYLLDKYSN
ncbi:MAG: M20/M25/M40 family metallo-hydrolase [Brumimicrobium sp.]|nr:M20/M25/M40 family metallo-hydrolase [Brumimicrobium sp.]